MAKNNAVLSTMKYMTSRINHIVTNVYGGMALALHNDIGLSNTQIQQLFDLTAEYWNASVNEGWDMTQKVADECDLNLVYIVERDIKNN